MNNDPITTAETPKAFEAAQLLAAAKAVAGLAVETNEEKNALLHSIDAVLTAAFQKNPDQAMGVLMLAQVLAFRRLLAHHRISGRGHVHRVIRKATEEFEKRLKTYA